MLFQDQPVADSLFIEKSTKGIEGERDGPHLQQDDSKGVHVTLFP